MATSSASTALVILQPWRETRGYLHYVRTESYAGYRVAFFDYDKRAHNLPAADALDEPDVASRPGKYRFAFLAHESTNGQHWRFHVHVSYKLDVFLRVSHLIVKHDPGYPAAIQLTEALSAPPITVSEAQYIEELLRLRRVYDATQYH